MICKIQHTFMGVKCISIPSNSFIRPGDKGSFVLVVDFPHYMDVVVPNYICSYDTTWHRYLKVKHNDIIPTMHAYILYDGYCLHSNMQT